MATCSIHKTTLEYDGRDHYCKECRLDFVERPRRRRLSTHEKHQLAADNGVDTWEDFRGER